MKMKVSMKGIRVSTWVYISGVAIFTIVFVLLLNYCRAQCQQQRTYIYTEKNLSEAQDGLGLEMTMSEPWEDEEFHANTPWGAQYDVIVTNESEYTFENWAVDLELSDSPVIDSSWNGDFATRGNQLSFVASGDVNKIAPKGSTSFGAVLYATDLMSMKECKLTGYRIVRLQDMLAFRILVTAAFLWLLAMIMHVVIYLKTQRYKERQELDQKIINQSMNMFTGFIDAKDSYTRGHSSRVADYAAEIGRRMKMDDSEVRTLYQIALMHDCGKIGIPDAVLKKPGPLLDGEYEIIKSHTTMGDEVLVNFTAIPGIRDGAHYHHERYDGTGYPAGLAGEDIPLYARIICIADAFDAMSSDRCYRKQLADAEIEQELKNNVGRQFDPHLVGYMIDMMKDGFAASVQQKYTSGAVGAV